MGEDTHAYVLKHDNKIVDYRGRFIDGLRYSEAIKGSNRAHAGLRNFQALGGYEDVIDCVRGNLYVFDRAELSAAHSRTFITLKGGITEYHLSNLTLIGNVRGFLFGLIKYDITLGDHSIYGYEAGPVTKGRIKNVRRADRKPVKILCVHAEKPEVLDGEYVIHKVPEWAVKALFWFKKVIG